jgi:hypothetical protein
VAETVHRRLIRAVRKGGWNRLSDSSSWYRWRRDDHGVQYREELCVLYQGGRIHAWSVWRNYRIIPPDQEAGRTDRLIAYAKEAKK